MLDRVHYDPQETDERRHELARGHRLRLVDTRKERVAADDDDDDAHRLEHAAADGPRLLDYVVIDGRPEEIRDEQGEQQHENGLHVDFRASPRPTDRLKGLSTLCVSNSLCLCGMVNTSDHREKIPSDKMPIMDTKLGPSMCFFRSTSSLMIELNALTSAANTTSANPTSCVDVTWSI
ncbi:universal stress protein [Babesia caballi]|uniref:Universal stress protein n=1 Tax=Babesia caballi TaxID=5871 RepID=A0AAV4LN07_BABCB|nr:universal stress protein [Babesia caballi]